MPNETYLLLVSIGPVQDFIAAARRTSDLWYGSWLLSELAKSAAKRIVESEGEDSLIFPALPVGNGRAAIEPGSELNVANKILAQVTQPEALAAEINTAILERLRGLWARARSSIRGKYDAAMAAQQIEDLIEFYWVAVPLRGPTHYPEARAQAETLMAARKNTRDFRPVSWRARQYKSPLDGQRESVLPAAIFEGKSEGELYRSYRIKTDEWLSGVDLLKRHGDLGRSWPSTSDMAARPLKVGPLRHHKEAVQHYLARLGELHDPEHGEALPIRGDEFDGELLFEDRLRDFFAGSALEEAQRALGALLKSADAEKPLPYYAILQADGDEMGRLLSRLTRLPPAGEAMERHRELSRRLTAFAEEARRIVREYDGALIYSGGDDALALLPLHTALDCAKELAAAFRLGFEGEQYRHGDGDRERWPTLSVGIAIVHHLEPLYHALQLARRAEQRAKQIPGKNALALLVSKRGAAERMLAGPWEQVAGKSTLHERLELFRELHEEKKLSGRTAYELRDLALRVPIPASTTAHERETFRAAREWAALRILSRRREEGGEQPLAESDRERLERFIKEEQVSLSQLADELIVASLLADARRLAAGSAGQQRERQV